MTSFPAGVRSAGESARDYGLLRRQDWPRGGDWALWGGLWLLGASVGIYSTEVTVSWTEPSLSLLEWWTSSLCEETASFTRCSSIILSNSVSCRTKSKTVTQQINNSRSGIMKLYRNNFVDNVGEHPVIILPCFEEVLSFIFLVLG